MKLITCIVRPERVAEATGRQVGLGLQHSHPADGSVLKSPEPVDLTGLSLAGNLHL